jgi:DNA-binding response OmpR family regulator
MQGSYLPLLKIIGAYGTSHTVWDPSTPGRLATTGTLFSMGGKMKIIVIDDDPAMTDLLKIILSSASAEIMAANTGTEGIFMTKKFAPNIVILDLIMPEMDGWEVSKAIREFSNVPILILSALDQPGLVAQALDAGADDYLVKPVSSGELLAHIKRLVRRNFLECGVPVTAALQ